MEAYTDFFKYYYVFKLLQSHLAEGKFWKQMLSQSCFNPVQHQSSAFLDKFKEDSKEIGALKKYMCTLKWEGRDFL